MKIPIRPSRGSIEIVTMISSMLMCLAFSLISANLISSTSIDVSVIDTLNLRASLPSDSTGFANTKCTVDSILEEPADKLVESNSDIEKASNIARRKTNECRLMEMGGEPPRWATWENWMDIGWRAPATAPEMLEHAQPPQSIIDSEFCLNKLYPHLLSCSTPEVWYDGVMGLVLNCVKGMSRSCDPSINN